MKQKAARNKTIDFSLEEGHEYLERCILAENGDQLKTALQDGSAMTPDALYDQYIIGDTFQVMKELPPNFVDLLILDTPYNLAKDYHGNKFNAVGRIGSRGSAKKDAARSLIGKMGWKIFGLRR